MPRSPTACSGRSAASRGTSPGTRARRRRAAPGTTRRGWAEMDGLLFGLTLATAVASGLVGGVFFAFSNFVMKALGRLRPSEGAAAMQAINVTVINPLFMTALFGTGLTSLVLLVWGLAELDEPFAGWLIAAGGVYVGGGGVLTGGGKTSRKKPPG